MQLALRQDREADPMWFVVTHFTEYAADRRDVMFLPQYSVNHLIPGIEFEKAILDRFVPIQASHAALEDFPGLTMQHKISVTEYNAVYLQKRQEINDVPHTDVPDATAQATTYSSGLHEHLRSQLESRLDVLNRHNMQYLMSLMLQLESVNVTARMVLGKPFRTSRTHAGTNKSSTAVQLKTKAAGHSNPSQTTQARNRNQSEKRVSPARSLLQ